MFPAVAPTRGLRDYVVHLKFAGASATEAAFPIEAEDLLSTRLLVIHTPEHMERR